MFDLEKEYLNILKKISFVGKAKEMEQIIRQKIWELIAEIPTEASVVIRGGGVHTQKLMKIIREKYTEKDFHIYAIIDNGMAGQTVNGLTIIDKECASKLQYEAVIISSYSYANEMINEYDSSKYMIFNIYQKLEDEGIILSAPFYYYREQTYETALYYINQYKEEPSKENLEYVIDAVLEIKDFFSAFQFINRYIKMGYDENGFYKEISSDLEKLFNTVKEIIANRDGKDILMFWVDAVPYAKLEWLPYVYSKRKKSCFFEHVYTVTPHTHAVMHILLQGILRIDNYDDFSPTIDENNSEVIQDLEAAGYEFSYIGYNATEHISPKYILKENMLNCENPGLNSMCIVYWQMLCALVNAKKPVFYILHSVAETHEPYISLNLDSTRSYTLTEALALGQNEISYQYANSQIKFYSDFLNDKITKIYMSDHGNQVDWEEWRFKEERIRPFFLIESKKIGTQQINRMFSYQNFKYIIKWLLSENDANLYDALSDYALIQDVDVYSPNAILKFLKGKNIEAAMTFRGIVTKHDKYIKIGNGREFYYILDQFGEQLEEVSRHQERVDKLREKAGEKFLDINEYEKFHASRKLYLQKPETSL